jgi:hypothetical protein
MISVKRKTPWFDNSLKQLINDQELQKRPFRTIYGYWEQEYGYHISCDKFGFAHKVIFPNEGEATLFVLRWS